jgi:hypothetical protein
MVWAGYDWSGFENNKVNKKTVCVTKRHIFIKGQVILSILNQLNLRYTKEGKNVQHIVHTNQS